jgi:hypothetical protein
MEHLRSHWHDTGFVASVVLLFVFYALLRGVRDLWRIAVLLAARHHRPRDDLFHRGSAAAGEAEQLSVWPKAVGRNPTRVGVFRQCRPAERRVCRLRRCLPLIAWLCLVYILLPL